MRRVEGPVAEPGDDLGNPGAQCPSVTSADDVVQTRAHQPRLFVPRLLLWIGEVRADGCGVRVADCCCAHQRLLNYVQLVWHNRA